jgi:hypothetical protein
VSGWRFVAANGNDATADGSIAAPYLTLAAAFASITDATQEKLYAVIVSGKQDFGAALQLPPWVFVCGIAPQQASLTSSIGGVSLSPAWATIPGAYAGFVGLTISAPMELFSTNGVAIIVIDSCTLAGIGVAGESDTILSQLWLSNSTVDGFTQLANCSLYSQGTVYLEEVIVTSDSDDIELTSSGDTFEALTLTRTNPDGQIPIFLGNSSCDRLSVEGGFNVQAGVAPAGATMAGSARFEITSEVRTTGQDSRRWTSGAGSPAGVVPGRIGDLYTNVNGGATTTLWVKTIGTDDTAGWTAK